MAAIQKEVIIYRTKDGKRPFSEWLLDLRDRKARAIVNTRINRIQLGNVGDAKPVGEGVSELRIKYGPGYRVYFGQDGQDLVILLCGGDKSSQESDIKRAKEFWTAYKEEKKNAN